MLFFEQIPDLFKRDHGAANFTGKRTHISPDQLQNDYRFRRVFAHTSRGCFSLVALRERAVVGLTLPYNLHERGVILRCRRLVNTDDHVRRIVETGAFRECMVSRRTESLARERSI
jgi:hypothetical protein